MQADLLTETHLDLAPQPTIDGLDLVGLIRWQLVVINSPVVEVIGVVWLLLRIKVILKEQVAS